MFRKLLRAKLHRATVTHCDPEYVGSLTVDENLLRASGIRPNEAVHIYDLDNADRFETYIIRGAPGSGVIGVNGAAAHLTAPGHRVIVACYCLLADAEVDRHVARVVLCDEHNGIAELLNYHSHLDEALVDSAT